MTVKEMHVDVQDQVQRLSANRNRKLMPQQIDWALNRAQTMLIESAVEAVSGSGRVRVKPNKGVVVSGLLSGRVVKPAGWINDRYVTLLPPDFWWMLDDSSGVCQLCKGDVKTTTYEAFNLNYVKFPYSTLTTPGYYKTLELTYNNSPLFNLSEQMAARQITWDGVDDVEEHFYIRDFLIRFLQGQGIEVYWERWHSIYKPYTLIFVSTEDAVPIVLNVDGEEYTNESAPFTVEFHNGPRKSVISPNTMIAADKGFATEATPYFRSSYISPVSELSAGALHTYGSESYIVCNTHLNYIRKPRMISLILGTDCELSPSVHQELCNRTATMILNRIKTDDWKEVTEQNIISQQS